MGFCGEGGDVRSRGKEELRGSRECEWLRFCGVGGSEGLFRFWLVGCFVLSNFGMGGFFFIFLEILT